MSTALMPSGAKHCTLYELEHSLQALVDSMLTPDVSESQQVILAEIGEALRRTKAKRDAVVAFLRHCEQQEQFADAEIGRIYKRKEFIVRVRAELERCVIKTIDEFGASDRRGIKRLEGNFRSMRVQKNPDSVMITDVDVLPLAWKDVILTMPAYAWEALLQRLDLEERAVFEQQVKKAEFKPEKKAIAAELKVGVEIPGADLKFGDLRLVID